jgi:hypothetical protein
MDGSGAGLCAERCGANGGGRGAHDRYDVSRVYAQLPPQAAQHLSVS